MRNVALTGPYGHNGAYPDLEGIRHHFDPFPMRTAWQPKLAALPSAPWLEQINFLIATGQLEMGRSSCKKDIEPVHLTKHQIEDVVEILQSLTGENAKQGPAWAPRHCPYWADSRLARYQL